MHKIAEATSLASALFVLAALRFAEVCNWRVLSHDHSVAVVAAVHAFHRSLSLGLILILEVDIADHVVANIVRNHHFINLAKLGHLHEHFLIESLKVLDRFDQILFWHVTSVRKSDRCVRILVHVLETESLRKWRLVVDTRASVAMPARAYLEVERTVDFVLLCSENTLQSLRHLCLPFSE